MIDLFLTWLSKRSKASARSGSNNIRPEATVEPGTIHPIAKKFFNMSLSQKRQVHLALATIALKQWQKYAGIGTIPRSYTETVCGTQEQVDLGLPSDALTCVLDGTDPAGVSERYLEPITALKDDDWALPDDPQYAYFAIYNTFRKYALGQEMEDWLIVNQALSSLGENSPEIDVTFETVVNNVLGIA